MRGTRLGPRSIRTGLFVGLCVLAACSSKGSPVDTEIGRIFFDTQAVPAGGAGQLYNVRIEFRTEGGAAKPDRFELEDGSLPPGIVLVRDRTDADFDGLPDPDGAFTGNARLLGFPREPGSFQFTIQAISTGALAGLAQNLDQPDLAASLSFTVNIGEGSVNVLNPTAAEGTSDPAVVAFPEVIDFVNPANPNAFFSFAFQVAGGSGSNLLDIFLPRELELSVFDAAVAAGGPLSDDLDETAGSGDKFSNDFSDGGLFVLQAGNRKVQLGGFQSPRGPVGTITSLDPDWFQSPAVPKNSRRDVSDTLGLAGGDNTLGTLLPVRFSDYFAADYEGTHPSFAPAPGSGLSRRKYPFTADQYANAFFLPFNDGVDITPLRYRAIVQAIDTRGTADRSDDIVFRKAYVVQVRIPDIVIDSVVLPAGQAGVDYVEFVNASGGVPPLRFDLEGVDGTQNLALDTGDPLDKDLFGLELDADTGQFFGLPRASSAAAGSVELTVRVFADVMNPTQNGATPIPTGTAGEFDGLNLDTGKRGRHKTFPVGFGLPTAPMVVNNSLVPGVDGQAYPGDKVAGTGGVARLVPYPVGFTGTYPSSQAARNYEWVASHVLDTSHGANAGDPAPGLPRSLALDGDPLSATNGQINGTPTDRGFHPVQFTGTDVYAGDAGSASASGFRQVFSRQLTLSVSPDTAVYLRGRQAAEGPGGDPSGLEDSTSQIGEARMVPMFLAASLYTVDTGAQPDLKDFLPAQIDLLPILLVNGGSDAHNRKSIPSLSGYWPAESNKETGWVFNQTRAWAHLQQEMVWAQPPGSARRVYLWAETRLKKYNTSAGSGGQSKRYQQYDVNGDRGILVVDPLSGDFWIPAVLSNSRADSNTDGSQFGAELVMHREDDGTFLDSSMGVGYWKPFERGATDSRWDRELHTTGLGSYLESFDSSSSSTFGWNRTSQGRTGVSIAMSADGLWCATALPGGADTQKLLLWRTDKQPIASAILAQDHVSGVDGLDSGGAALADSAAILDLGGRDFGGFTLDSNQADLLPDSLMFVEGGLLFLDYGHLDRVFGISLADGSLSSLPIGAADRDEVNGAGKGPDVASATRGMYVPDNDYLRGLMAQQAFHVQFAFSGDEPDAGEEGPDRVAFVAGDNRVTKLFASSGVDTARTGIIQQGNRNKALLFLELATDASGGLDLGASTLKDLTGSSSSVYGDLLTPGRFGEEQDWVKVSHDGNYVAVVRDIDTTERISTFSANISTFATTSTTGTSWTASDDLLVISTQGADMDSGTTGTQHVLFVGTRSLVGGAGNPSVPSYASGRNLINAKFKRVNGLTFAPDDRTLIFNFAGTGASNSTAFATKYYGSTSGFAINPSQAGTFSFGSQMIVQLDFRNAGSGAAVNFAGAAASSIASNLLQGTPGVGNVGPTSAPFNDTSAGGQLFWASFKSHNGEFLYYISDQLSGRNYMVGFNLGRSAVNGRQPFVPFSPHSASIGFEQFDVNSFNYENRFAAAPAGVSFQGRDAAGILVVIASDASAGPTSATDLEAYVMDADIGGNMIAVTPDVTPGTANAINYLYLSADGNVLVGQRAATTANSRDVRGSLTTTNDLFAVTNLHAVLGGATPDAFVLSKGLSHGSSVAFVGEGTGAGPQALIYSAAAAGTNQTWDDRTLRIVLLGAGQTADLLDSTKSHYAVLAGGRKLDDDPDTAD